ncbi:MAG: DUF4383 domain-containing protein [Phycisphaerae bacterium]|nr:DUF4383 domain-containing protein [Phycisphaerae bacterium]
MTALVCRLCGFILLGLGLWGFAARGSFWVFEVNPVQHILQVALGSAALWASWSDQRVARKFCIGSAAAYGFVALLGFLNVPAVVDFLSLNRADHWLHLLIGGTFLAAVALSRTALATGHTGRTDRATPAHGSPGM